jgi:hypothetical protein
MSDFEMPQRSSRKSFNKEDVNSLFSDTGSQEKQEAEKNKADLVEQAHDEAILINEVVDRGNVNVEVVEKANAETIDSALDKIERKKEGNNDNRAEKVVSPEQLKANIDMLEANASKLDKIPEKVLQSREGQEATQSFMGKMTGRLAGFRDGIVNKLATLDSWKGKDRLVAVLGGVAGAAILAPLVLQLARSKWPEVGVALDSAPDALQQFIHMDIWEKVAQAFGHGGELHSSMWANSGIEINNLLADISSGKESMVSLNVDQLDMLKDCLRPQDFLELTSSFDYSSTIAERAGNIPTVLRTVFGNTALVVPAGLGMYGVMSKIGSLANKFKTKTAA